MHATRTFTICALLQSVAICRGGLRRTSALSEPQANGPTFAGTKCFDDMVINTMKENNIPGSSFAVLARGKIVYAQGYGSIDVPGVGSDAGRKVMPYTPFRIASISKPVTALAFLRLEQLGQLALDDLVFGPGGHLEDMYANPNPNRPVLDSRLKSITIRHLLTHTAGFMSDPMIICRSGIETCSSGVGGAISQALGVPGPVSCTDIIYFMFGEVLLHKPGTRNRYSNFGYCVLGRVLESVTGKSYEQAMRDVLLDPAGVNPWEMYLGHTLLGEIRENETEYYCPNCPLADSVFPESNGQVQNPYGAWNLEAMDAHGGWVASAQQLMLIMKAMNELLTEDSRQKIMAKPPAYAGEQIWYGLGFTGRTAGHGHNIWHDGLLPGSSSLLVQYFSGYAIAHLHNVHGAVNKFNTWGLIQCVQGNWPSGFSMESPAPPTTTITEMTTTRATTSSTTSTTTTSAPITITTKVTSSTTTTASSIGYEVRPSCEPGTEITSSTECQTAYAEIPECTFGSGCRWGTNGSNGDQSWSAQRPSHCSYHPWGIVQHWTGSYMPTVNQDCMQHGFGGCICKTKVTMTTTTTSRLVVLSGEYEVRPSCEPGSEIRSSAECKRARTLIPECTSSLGCTWGTSGNNGDQIWSAQRPSHCSYHPWGIVQHWTGSHMPTVNQDCMQHGFGGCICKKGARRLGAIAEFVLV